MEIFKLLKIASGYAELINDGIIIHLTDTKAILIPKNELITMKDKVKPLRDYHITKFYSVTDVGSNSNNVLSISVAFLINYFSEFTCWAVQNKKPYVKIENIINVYEDNSVLNFCGKTEIVFNTLMVTLSLIKIFIGKLYYGITNKEQQN